MGISRGLHELQFIVLFPVNYTLKGGKANPLGRVRPASIEGMLGLYRGYARAL